MVKPGSRCRTTVSTTTRSDRGRCGVNSGEVSGRYKGVRMRKWGKWVAEVRQPNSRDRIWLGSYERPDEAARAYDAAVFCLRGPSAVLNFPDSPPQIPSAADLSPPQIREAALRHARGNTTSTEGEEEEKHADAEESCVAPATTFVNSPQIHGGGSSNLVIPLRDQRYSYLPSAAAAEQRGGGEDIRITGGGYYQLPRVWSF